MLLEAPVLTGRAVTLRRLATDDVEALTLAAAESRTHFGLSVVPSSLEEMQRYIEKHLLQQSQGRRVPFATIWHGRIVGTTSFIDPQIWDWPSGAAHQRADRPDTVEIGSTWLASSAQRTGCNTEAKLLMLEHAFERWQTHSVSFKTDERNERSRRAIERLGARFDGIRRADMPAADGTVRNSAYYSIVATEWPTIKQRLQQLMNR